VAVVPPLPRGGDADMGIELVLITLLIASENLQSIVDIIIYILRVNKRK
jgi:hypothetical protein